MKTATAAALLVIIGISLYAARPLVAENEASDETFESYVPGLGEIMGATQMRHSKIWFAGSAGNWDLARYELTELQEGFDDAAIYHPQFKHGAQIASLAEQINAKPLSEVEAAINAEDSAAFTQAYDDLTHACNVCHVAAGQGFIVIKRPAFLPYSNQAFAVKKE